MPMSFSVEVYPLKNPQWSTKAFGTLILEDMIEVKGWRILKGKNGLWVSRPSHKGTNSDGEEEWFPDVWFREEAPEGEFKGPFEAEIERAFISKFKEVASGSARHDAAQRHAERGEQGSNEMTNEPGW